MTRCALNLDLTENALPAFNVMLHAIPGAGKTHLLGDCLRAESKHGDVRFLNIAGEDGYLSIANLGLGTIGETVETYKDFREVLVDWAGKGLQAVTVDSFHRFCDLVMVDMFGERLPQSGDSKTNEWTLYHYRMRGETDQLRKLAKIVVVSCLSDRYVDPVTAEPARINPDLPGAQSRLAVARFDFVGYIEAKTMGPQRVKRTLDFTPSSKITTRQRLPVPITSVIDIPEGGGGWRNFLNCVNVSMQKAQKGT